MSTTIQKHIFKQDNSSLFLGVNSENDLISDNELYMLLNYDNHLYDVAILERDILQVNLKLKKEGKKLIFSSEDVLISPMLDRVAERLATIFPDPEILLIIRNQDSAIRSFYKSHGAFNRPSARPYFKRHLTPTEWWSHNISKEFRMTGPIHSFDYKLVINTFKKFINEEKIHLLVFEEFLENPLIFCEKFAKVSGIDQDLIFTSLSKKHENRSVSKNRVFLNMLTSRFLGFSSEYIIRYTNGHKRALMEMIMKIVPNVGVGLDFFNSEEFQEQLCDLYSEGNVWLDKEFDLKLERFGYVGCV
ncbi:hypothetical protein OAS88_00965 [Planktomarina temperata]|nr:hypothetical protein [Planktomarina temperata]MDC1094175.1 hypothetical protein [Planktomarina temperata]